MYTKFTLPCKISSGKTAREKDIQLVYCFRTVKGNQCCIKTDKINQTVAMLFVNEYFSLYFKFQVKVQPTKCKLLNFLLATIPFFFISFLKCVPGFAMITSVSLAMLASRKPSTNRLYSARNRSASVSFILKMKLSYWCFISKLLFIIIIIIIFSKVVIKRQDTNY